MTPEREKHLREVVRTAKCLGELDGIRGQLSLQGELTTDLMRDIRERQDWFIKHYPEQLHLRNKP